MKKTKVSRNLCEDGEIIDLEKPVENEKDLMEEVELKHDKSRSMSKISTNSERANQAKSAQIEKIHRLLTDLASFDRCLRLSTIKSARTTTTLFAVKGFKDCMQDLLKSELEYINEYSEEDAQDTLYRIASFNLFGMFIWSKSELRVFFMKALRLTYADANEKIRLAALEIVNQFIDSAALRTFWGKIKGSLMNQIVVEDEKCAAAFGPFDVIEGLKKGNWKMAEGVFLVLSFVGANDTHRQVRLEAIRLVAKLAGSIKNPSVLQQAIKKDQINSTVPLLCCGLFAHGIEDQFVRIRLAALVSLNAHLSGTGIEDASEYFVVFLDALLDECELVRLAALKLLASFSAIKLTINTGLDSVLALLDDQSEEIRTTALFIIEVKLVFSTKKDPAAIVFESLLRTQRCLEAALHKFPQMESKALKAAFQLMARSKVTLERGCPDFFVHLLQVAIPKFMKPTNFLPQQHSPQLSKVHLIMQAACINLDSSTQLVKLLSRSNGFDANFLFRHSKYIPKTVSSKSITSKFRLLVGNAGDLSSKFKASSLIDRKKYFHGDEPLVQAYFRFDCVERSKNTVVIKTFKLIGPLEAVNLTLKTQNGEDRNFRPKYGTHLDAQCGDANSSFTILNKEQIVYSSSN